MAERPTYDERYEVQSPEKQRALRTIASLVDDETPEGMGFAVFLFDYGPNGAMFYMSSAQREGVLTAIKEWVAREDAKAAKGGARGH